MSARLNLPARVAVLSAAVALVSLSAASPMAFAGSTVAADDNVDVINTETVQVYMDPEGKILSQRVYEQLVLTGKGSVDIENPISEDNLRNLDGFSGFTVEDGEQITEADVDGVTRLRSVSDYNGKLPLEIDVSYKLDGKSVKPGDIVGEDGELEVEFTVTNVTGEEQEITIPDGKGGTLTKTATVPLPIVGSLVTFAPSSFANVKSKQANMAGDGKGATKLSFTMTLFPPIGSESATFGYTADIEDGVVPRVEISSLPVNPLQSPSFANAATSYQGGADTGTELAAGATEIDTNLLKLRDGASDLLAGLLKLHAGSAALEAGLSGKAVPGAEKLADGAGDLDDGLGQIDDGAGQIDDGANQLSDGADRLSDGTGDAVSGSQQLTDGLALISGGLEQLADTEGLPKAAAGVDLLKAGVDQILAGFGSVGQTGTLIDGLNKLEVGAGQLEAGATQLKGGLTQLGGGSGLPAAKGGVDQVKAGLDASLAPNGSMDKLIGGLNALLALDCGPICQSVITDQILPGVQTSRTNLEDAADALGQVSTGLATAIGAVNGPLLTGAGQIEAGLGQLETGAGKAKAGAIELKGGVAKVRAGLVELDTGLTKAVAGVLQLNSGASDAYAGSGELTDGLGLIDGGAGELADGADRLADGTGQLAAGTGEAAAGSALLAGGAADLFDGLSDAAAGSGLLTAGLAKAADGAPLLVDGAGRLSKEGTQVIAGKGAETAQNYGELYAVLEAGAQRAQTEDMAYGAPEGANGLTAYNYIIKAEEGEDGRNWARGIAGLGLLAAGGGVFFLRRRLA